MPTTGRLTDAHYGWPSAWRAHRVSTLIRPRRDQATPQALPTGPGRSRPGLDGLARPGQAGPSALGALSTRGPRSSPGRAARPPGDGPRGRGLSCRLASAFSQQWSADRSAHQVRQVRPAGSGTTTSAPVRTPSRSAIVSATRSALAMIVSVGFTAVLETKKLESAT